MRRIAAVLVLAVWCSVPARADYQLGLEAWERGDWETALAEWRPMAEGGHAEAQYRMGRLYYYGRGVERDLARAADWYRRAAEQGHARAQSNLGLLYETGRGVGLDEAEAARWYRFAAEQGRTFAQVRLGRLHEEGRGVAKDDAEAARLYETAARQGDPEAQAALARMLDEGRGVERDARRARKLRKRAARQGVSTPAVHDPYASDDPDERDDLDERAPDTTPAGGPPGAASDEPAPTRERAEEAWARGEYERAFRAWLALAETGDPEAQVRVAGLLRSGQGTAADALGARSWYERAAEQGHGQAMYELGFLLLRGDGRGIRPDLPGAWVWFARAAEAGIGDAGAWRDRVDRDMNERERRRARERYGAE